MKQNEIRTRIGHAWLLVHALTISASLTMAVVFAILDPRGLNRAVWVIPFGGCLVLAGLVVHGIHLSRRARRADHGLCPRCGYDLRTLRPIGQCPECGREYDIDLVRKSWKS